MQLRVGVGRTGIARVDGELNVSRMPEPLDLSLFESHDVVSEWYSLRHGREVAAAKVAEITSNFTQGRQYFEAAKTAGSLVLPLLLYYGVVAFTRGAVLFLDERMRQATLKPAHGLSARNWEAQLATGIGNVGNLAISIETSGTFSEFVRATSNRSRVPAFANDNTRKIFEVRGTDVIPKQSDVTLNDVLSRIAFLHELHETVLGVAADIFAISLHTNAAKTELRVDLFGSSRNPPDIQKLKQYTPQLASATISDVKQGAFDERKFVTFSLAADEPLTGVQLPPLRYSGGVTWFQLPFFQGLDLSQAAVLFLFSFAVGMLSRYHPQRWLELLSGGRGAKAYLLIREGLRLVEESFASEIAREVSE